jgi:hypothetical protein
LREAATEHNRSGMSWGWSVAEGRGRRIRRRWERGFEVSRVGLAYLGKIHRW